MIKNRLATLTAGVVTAVMLVGHRLRDRLGGHVSDVSAAHGGEASDVGIQAQARFDGDHWWIKVSTAEIVSLALAPCAAPPFDGVGWFVCAPIVAAIEAALAQNPNVGGVWAELYTYDEVRLGTW